MLAIWYLGKDFAPKNLRDTVLAIWVLGRDSFQNSRGTVLAIECLGRISKKKLWGTALAIWDLGRVSFERKLKGHGAWDLGFGKRFCSKNLRDTVLAIECLGRIFRKKNYGARRLRFGIWEGLVSKGN